VYAGGWRRQSPGGWGGRRGGGGWGGGRREEYGDQEPQRPGQVGEEAARVLGADGGGPVVWRGARASADFWRPPAAEKPVGQRTGAPRKAVVGKDDIGGGGGHDDDDCGGSGTKKWLSA
jgi:hypothetical protein